jgi:hypothetical protein
MTILNKFLNLFNYNEQRRRNDVELLWPSCVKQAPDLDHAKAAFAFHAFNDEAWKPLGPDEIARRIDRLT